MEEEGCRESSYLASLSRGWVRVFYLLLAMTCCNLMARTVEVVEVLLCKAGTVRRGEGEAGGGRGGG